MMALEVHAPAMSAVTVVLDPATGLIVKVGYSVTATPGDRSTTTPMEEAYSDYRDVRGLKIAYKTLVSRGGKPFIDREVRSFEFNVPIEPGLFNKPS